MTALFADSPWHVGQLDNSTCYAVSALQPFLWSTRAPFVELASMQPMHAAATLGQSLHFSMFKPGMQAAVLGEGF